MSSLHRTKFFSQLQKSRARYTLYLALAVFLSFGITGCKKETEQKVELSPLAQTGKTIYMSRCIACHNADPKLAGSLGPDIAGSSIELIKLKVTRGVYPEGHTPKRPTKIMTVMPDLSEPDIQALHAFISN